MSPEQLDARHSIQGVAGRAAYGYGEEPIGVSVFDEAAERVIPHVYSGENLLISGTACVKSIVSMQFCGVCGSR